MDDKTKIETTISCLRHAIDDVQKTIRGYDTKAQILGALIIGVIAITNYAYVQNATTATRYLLVAACIVGFFGIGAIRFVLKPRKDVFKAISFGTYTPSGTYFLANLDSSPQNTVTHLANKALETDWVHELTYENMKLSIIREYKDRLYSRAELCLLGVLFLIAVLVIVDNMK